MLETSREPAVPRSPLAGFPGGDHVVTRKSPKRVPVAPGKEDDSHGDCHTQLWTQGSCVHSVLGVGRNAAHDSVFCAKGRKQGKSLGAPASSPEAVSRPSTGSGGRALQTSWVEPAQASIWGGQVPTVCQCCRCGINSWEPKGKSPENRTAGIVFLPAMAENHVTHSADLGIEASESCDLSSGVKSALEQNKKQTPKGSNWSWVS